MNIRIPKFVRSQILIAAPTVGSPSGFDEARTEKMDVKGLAPCKPGSTVSSEECSVAHDVDVEKPVQNDWAHNPRNPLNWSKTRKWTMIMVIGITNLVT